MGPSDLNRRVQLQSRTQAAIGGASGTTLSDSYSTVASVWANIAPLRGGRYIAGRQTEEIATHRLTIRYRADAFTPSWRFVLHGTQRFEVRQIRDQDGSKRFLELDCEELTP